MPSIENFMRKLRNFWLNLGYFDFAFLLAAAQGLFTLMCALVIFEILGFYGILLDLFSLLAAVVFDRLLGKILVRMLRKHLALVLYLIFQISLFGLIGTVGLGLAKGQTQVIYLSFGLGLWASIVCSLQSYRTLELFQGMVRLGLDFSKVNEIFMQLPDSFRADRSVFEAYSAALGVIPVLYSSNEYLATVITAGNIFQGLLDAVDRSPNTSPATKAKRIGLNVSFEETTADGKSRTFDFEYFWHNVRSKHAHLTVLSRFGIEEPSQEIARKSVGLLCAFLKAYPVCVGQIENERSV